MFPLNLRKTYVVTSNCLDKLHHNFRSWPFRIFSGQPYWKEVGTTPWLSDYLYWFSLLLNGISGLIAVYVATYITDVYEAIITSIGMFQIFDVRFVPQYLLWLLLICPQWFIYRHLADLAFGIPRRIALLCWVALALAIGGCVHAVHSLMWNISYGQKSGLFVNLYDEPVLIFTASISGLWVVALILLKAERDRAPE